MKGTVTSILIALVLIGGVFVWTKINPKTENNPPDDAKKSENKEPSINVVMEEGIQIVEIKARGGYTPRTSYAKAGIPTTIRFNTTSTFDCSSVVRISKYNISRNLPISGITDIEIPALETGTLRGSCGMGMYSFEVVFQN